MYHCQSDINKIPTTKTSYLFHATKIIFISGPSLKITQNRSKITREATWSGPEGRSADFRYSRPGNQEKGYLSGQNGWKKYTSLTIINDDSTSKMIRMIIIWYIYICDLCCPVQCKLLQTQMRDKNGADVFFQSESKAAWAIMKPCLTWSRHILYTTSFVSTTKTKATPPPNAHVQSAKLMIYSDSRNGFLPQNFQRNP